MGKNILITGGELFNKGAQAMVFTVVNEMNKKYPDKDIYLLSTRDYKRDQSEKDKYTFNILPFTFRFILRQWKMLKMIFKTKKITREEEDKLNEIIKDTEFIINISGYALSSQFSVVNTVTYMGQIALFKKHNIDMYIFPQSLGPFEYKFPWNYILSPFLSKYLKYPKKIFPREKDGLKRIRKFTDGNLEKSVDIVLQQREINLENIFRNEIEMNNVKIEKNSVAIVPNVKLKKHNSGNEILEVYRQIVKVILGFDKKVYILRHSFEDLDFCKEIKGMFKNNKDVILIENDLNAIELNNIINQFDYIVGSRYHSVVHSYKNNVPALIIGWAVKYKELAQYFGQEKYCFDIRKELKADQIISQIKFLNSNYSEESEKITTKLIKIREMNIFDKIKK